MSHMLFACWFKLGVTGLALPVFAICYSRVGYKCVYV